MVLLRRQGTSAKLFFCYCNLSFKKNFPVLFQLQAKYGGRNMEVHTDEMLKGERLVPER